MNVIRKDATITNTGPDDAFPGEFEVILSAPTLDRDGDTLLPGEWKQPLPEHITFDQDHGMSVATTVGSGKPELDKETGNLIVRGTYSSLARAQEVRTLVNEQHIRTTSVAFMSTKEGKGPDAKSTRELLNGAFVAVPSNREALVLTSKSIAVKAGARNSAADSELIQAILDAALALGAAKPEGKAFGHRETKSIAGSLEAIQDRARAALRAAYPGSWAWLRGTIPAGDGAGELVFESEDRDTYETQLWRQSYTDDGTTITLTGERTAAGVTEVLTPDPEESEAKASPDGEQKAPAAGSTEPAAGASSDSSGDEAEYLATKAASIRARLALATITTPEE
ncbi:hypothetical protein [Rathayibacter sp. VKM Ac-2630]|uniref:hypothetical protein n=1 Tax=Rathayibacter sp. VKM Ac-2630 TaxID=1938617 RepID=UPI000981F91F|nr:hypothetical protein [Rathayibacter sp. VKM Ac-2630]OOB90297.1 hypothetical protein B0T42_12410 [Rathayibacter sp. VKM Ac-2630]